MNGSDSLRAKVHEEVMACIGCNDCMLACPLPQANDVTIAELNGAVHLPMIADPRLAEFVMACTQCRQCVPACPADLSRADMVLFNKIKVEDNVADYTMMLQVGATVVPSSVTLNQLAEQLSHLPLFNDVPRADLRRLCLKGTLRQLAPLEEVCFEGEFYDRLGIILHGALEQSALGIDGRPVHLLVLQQGSFFGEFAVMTDQPEAFTLRATHPSTVLEFPKAAVHRLMNISEAFRTTMDELYRRRALWTYARSRLFASLPEQAVGALFQQAELIVVKTDEVIFREGDTPGYIYIVKSGFLRVTRRIAPNDERAIVYLREGDAFGAMAILMSERVHGYSVKATTRAEVIRIPSAHVFAVMGQSPEARALLEGASIEVERVIRSTVFAPPSGSADPRTQLAFSAEVLVEKGLATGTEVLVVDQTKCTNCQNCVDACGRRHKYSRLQLRGLQVENYLFPTACRHCEDPVCLLCSVNGIVRLPSGEITIVEDNCIGCGACASRCPYGNISMHPVNPEKKGFFVGLAEFLGMRAKASGTKPASGPDAELVAVKCDLCAGYEDYACVTACPVGAAFRIDPMKALERAAIPSTSLNSMLSPNVDNPVNPANPNLPPPGGPRR